MVQEGQAVPLVGCFSRSTGTRPPPCRFLTLYIRIPSSFACFVSFSLCREWTPLSFSLLLLHPSHPYCPIRFEKVIVIDARD